MFGSLKGSDAFEIPLEALQNNNQERVQTILESWQMKVDESMKACFATIPRAPYESTIS
jgi:hypothetical protein